MNESILHHADYLSYPAHTNTHTHTHSLSTQNHIITFHHVTRHSSDVVQDHVCSHSEPSQPITCF